MHLFSANVIFDDEWNNWAIYAFIYKSSHRDCAPRVAMHRRRHTHTLVKYDSFWAHYKIDALAPFIDSNSICKWYGNITKHNGSTVYPFQCAYIASNHLFTHKCFIFVVKAHTILTRLFKAINRIRYKKSLQTNACMLR